MEEGEGERDVNACVYMHTPSISNNIGDFSQIKMGARCIPR